MRGSTGAEGRCGPKRARGVPRRGLGFETQIPSKQRHGSGQMSPILFCLAREFPESTACVLLHGRGSAGAAVGTPIRRRRGSRQIEGGRHADCRAKDRRGRTSASTRGHPAPGVHPRDEDTFHPQGKQKSADGDERVAASDPRLFDSSRRLSPPCAPSHTPSMSTSNAHLSSSVSYPSASFRSRARS